MKIPSLSVKHPITTIMVFLAMAVLGFISLSRVGQEMFPNVTVPTVVVVTTNPGVGPLEIESQITRKLEESVSTLNGVTDIKSESSESISMIQISLDWGTDMDGIVQEVREKITDVEAELPEGTERPRIFRYNPEQLPSMTLNMYTESEGIDVRKLAEDDVVPELLKTEGVAQVDVFGGREAAVVSRLDLESLAKLNIPISQVLQAFQGENINLPGGSISQDDQFIVLRTIGKFQEIKDIGNVLISYRDDIPVFLRDVADISLSYLPQEEFLITSGREGLRISVKKQSGTSTLEVNESVMRKLEELKSALPPSVRFEIQDNQADSVRNSIGGVATAAWQGGLLAIVVLLFFLRNIRSTLIISVVIPVSVIATFSLIDFGGFTINIVSLMGITMGIGMFVDNSIVVLESSYRKQLAGLSPEESAVEGTSEVGRAITASTLTTVSVFIPLLFIEGLAGLFFRDLSWTVSFSLLISLLVALTLIPVLCSKFLRVPKINGAENSSSDIEREELSLADVEVKSRFAIVNKIGKAIQRLLKNLDNIYERVIGWALEHSGTVIASAFILLVLSIGSILLLGMEFLPEADEGDFSVSIETRIGSTYDFTSEKVKQIQTIINDVCGDEIETMAARVGTSGSVSIAGDKGSNLANINVALSHKDERSESIWEIVDEINKRISNEVLDIDHSLNIEGLSSLATLASGSGSPIAVEIAGNDLDGMYDYARKVKDAIEGAKGSRNVQISYRSGKPELQFLVKRREALSLGLSPREIAATIRTAYKGSEVSRFSPNGDDYGIVLMLEEADRNDLSKLSSIFFVNRNGTKIPLENLVEIKTDIGPLSVSRKNKSRIMTITAALTGDLALSRVTEQVEANIEELGPPPFGIDLSYSGSSSEMASSFKSMFAALLLAIALVYMVMASQFESLLHPLIVMFSIPFAVIGLVAALLVTGTTFNLLAFVGAIMLVGIVVNNAIVLIDYINILRRRGLGLRKAIVRGGKTRLKPILMTTITTILGLLPMALGFGTGSEIRAPMGRAVVGGLLTSTLITLILIPSLYWLAESALEKRRARAGTTGAGKKVGKLITSSMLLLFFLVAAPVFAESGRGGVDTDFSGADLSVEEALSTSLANAESVRIKRHEIKKAEYALWEARSRRFPQIDLQASASYLANPQDDIVVKAGELGELPEYAGADVPPGPPTFTIPLPNEDYVFMEGAEHTYFELKASLTQPIYTWGKISGAVDAANYDREIQTARLRNSEREIEREVKQAYYGVILARDSLVLLDETEKIARAILEDRRESYETGVINYQRVLEAEANLAGIRKERADAAESMQTAVTALEYYTGLTLEAAELSSGFIEGVDDLDQASLYRKSLDRSPELERLSLSVKQANANLDIQRGGHFLKPDLSLNVSFELTGQDFPYTVDNWTDSWNANIIVTLGTKLSLFDGLSSVWKIKQAEETLEVASLGLAQLQRGMELQIRQGIEAVKKAQSRLRELEVRLKLSRERYRNAKVSYENDLITREEELGAKLLEIQTELELLHARYGLQNAVVGLEYLVSGTVGQTPNTR